MEQKVKILFYNDKWLNGGIESFIMNIYRNINLKNLKIDILVSQNGTDIYDEEIKALGGKKYVTLDKTFKSPIKRTIANFSAFYKKVKQIDADIIHINLSNAVGMIYGFLAKKAGIKVVIFHSHNSDIANSNRKIKILGHEISQKIFEKYGDYYLACSQVAAKFMYSKNNIQNGNIKIIKNGINTDKFRYKVENREEYRNRIQADNKFVIGTIGRLSAQKNQEFLLKVFKEVYNKDKNTMLLLVGEGEKKKELIELAQKLEITDSVCFFGRTDSPEKCLSAMDVFVLPSLFEGNPVVGIEAQTNGLRCLFSDTITPEVKVTDLVTFLTIKNIEIWTDEILKIKSNNIRANKQQEVINSGYDIKDIAKKLEEFYCTIKK